MVHQWILRLHVGIFVGDVWNARTILCGIQVMVTDNQCPRVAPMEVPKQRAHSSLLFSRPRVGGLTADVEPALVAHAYRMGVVVQAVGTDHPFRTAWLNLSVTTDDVVVADAEVKASFPVPRINLCRGTRLVGPYCTAVNND